MKTTTLSLIGMCLLAISCGNKKTSNPETETGIQKTDNTTMDDPKPSENKKALTTGESLMDKSDCYTCHNVDAKLIGPSFKEIAAKYTPTDENKNLLCDKIINGGSGVWGQVPMQAHSQLSKEDASEMLNYILSLSETK